MTHYLTTTRLQQPTPAILHHRHNDTQHCVLLIIDGHFYTERKVERMRERERMSNINKLLVDK